jgi:hypothetical protein
MRFSACAERQGSSPFARCWLRGLIAQSPERPVLGTGGLREVVGAGLDLHADEEAAVEPSGVAGLHEQVGAEIMLRVVDHRPPADSLERSGDLAGAGRADLLLS